MSTGDLGDLANLDVATLQQRLPGVRFPAETEGVASTAERNGAPQQLVHNISDAHTQQFASPEEVLQAVQGR